MVFVPWYIRTLPYAKLSNMTILWRLIETGFAVIALLLVCYFLSYAFPESSFGLAAWVQAVGSIAAIIGSFAVAEKSHRDAIERDRQTAVENEFNRRRQNIVRITHHLIATINDMRSRVHYVETTLTRSDRPLAAVIANVKVLQTRYESLFDREAFEYLPGPAIDLLSNMSGSFFGMLTLFGSLEGFVQKNPGLLFKNEGEDRSKLIDSTKKLFGELDALLDMVYEVRRSID
jgi:hypothetical protein